MKLLAAIYLVLHIATAEVTAGVVSNEDLQNSFKQLEETVKAEQIEKRKLESTISNLQHELELCADHVISTGHRMTNLVSNFEYLL